jgi:hypothetical protein
LFLNAFTISPSCKNQMFDNKKWENAVYSIYNFKKTISCYIYIYSVRYKHLRSCLKYVVILQSFVRHKNLFYGSMVITSKHISLLSNWEKMSSFIILRLCWWDIPLLSHILFTYCSLSVVFSVAITKLIFFLF